MSPLTVHAPFWSIRKSAKAILLSAQWNLWVSPQTPWVLPSSVANWVSNLRAVCSLSSSKAYLSHRLRSKSGVSVILKTDFGLLSAKAESRQLRQTFSSVERSIGWCLSARLVPESRNRSQSAVVWWYSHRAATLLSFWNPFASFCSYARKQKKEPKCQILPWSLFFPKNRYYFSFAAFSRLENGVFSFFLAQFRHIYGFD